MNIGLTVRMRRKPSANTLPLSLRAPVVRLQSPRQSVENRPPFSLGAIRTP